jgi:hypothetical protein
LDDSSTEAHDGGVAIAKLSEVTINTYVRVVRRFARHFGKSPEQLGPEQVRQYLLHLLNAKGDAWSTLQVNRAALRFLYVKVLQQPWFDEEIAKPKKRPRLLSPVSTPDRMLFIIVFRNESVAAGDGRARNRRLSSTMAPICPELSTSL